MTQPRWRPTRYAEPSIIPDEVIDLPIAPEENRYLAAAVQNRYTAAPNRYTAAAPAPSRYANRYSSRYRRAGRIASPLRITRIIIAIPPPRMLHPDEELLWMPAWEYDQHIEDAQGALYMPGNEVDFDWVLEMMRQDNSDLNRDDDDNCELTMITVDNERETFQSDDAFFCTEVDMPIEQALRLRAQLAADPDWVVQILEQMGYWGPARWAGMPLQSVDQFRVAEALRKDSSQGLGAAALDSLVWEGPKYCGPDGVQLADALSKLEDEYGVRTTPVENFLMYSGSLHPGAASRPAYWRPKKLYLMTGSYVVTKVDYHSDLTGKVVAGWRSCWLERFEYSDPER
jgi:hypothetical protein